MTGSEPHGGRSSIDLTINDRADVEIHVDANAYTLAAVFGPVAFPAGIPEYRKTAILDRADQDRDAAGDLLIDNRMNPDDPRRRQARADTDEDDNISQFAQIVRQEHEEREREEWSRTKSTVGGVTMTGAEWAELAKRLRADEDLHRRLIEAFENRGMTTAEAETRYTRVADVAEIAAIPESQRTEAQAATFERANADPTFKQDMATVQAKLDRKLQAAPSLAVNDGPGSAGRNETGTSGTAPTSSAEQRPVTMATGPGF